MANEITIDFGSLNLNSTNNIAVEKISIVPKMSVKLSSIPKTNGSIAEAGKIISVTISVSGDIAGTDYDDLRTNLDTLRAGFQNGFQKFTTDDDRYMMAQLTSFNYSFKTLRTIAEWKAKFIAHYPFWLNESESTDDRTPTSGVGYVINNPGNADCKVKIEITAPGAGISDECQIENTTRGELCKYRGDIVAAKVLEIDNRYDTDDFQVLNDSIADFANFEGDFINLSPGNNTIEFTGTAATAVKLYYRGAWTP